jgi:hypothetical protein
MTINGPLEIRPLAFDANIGFVDIPFSSDLALPPMEALQQFGAEMQNPPMDGRMVHRDAPLSHHFLQIAQAQIVSQIPSNTRKDDGLIEMAAFEHRTIQLFES